jgi:hypothetical protein
MPYEHFRVPQDHAIISHNLQLRRCVGGRERCLSPMTHMSWKDYREFDSVEVQFRLFRICMNAMPPYSFGNW